jgi:hypothetical protein
VFTYWTVPEDGLDLSLMLMALFCTESLKTNTRCTWLFQKVIFKKLQFRCDIIASEDSLQDKTSSITILTRTTEDYVEDVLSTKQGRPMSIL